MPRDAITSKNVAWQIADFPFGIILNIEFCKGQSGLTLFVVVRFSRLSDLNVNQV